MGSLTSKYFTNVSAWEGQKVSYFRMVSAWEALEVSCFRGGSAWDTPKVSFVLPEAGLSM